MGKTISLLGSTGSIGVQALDVARMHGYKVAALAVGKNVKLAEAQAREFNPQLVAVADEKAAADLKTALADTSVKVIGGADAVCEAASIECDTVLNSIVGIAGLKPTIFAINAGRDIALANKETLVAAGSIVMKKAKDKNLSKVRNFGGWYGEHVATQGDQQDGPARRRITDTSYEQTEEILKKYISACFGEPLYDERTTKELERKLCVDSHKGCHLYYATGSASYDRSLRRQYAQKRKGVLKQMEFNRTTYEADALRNRSSILRLTARIQNAMMTYLQPTVSRTSSGMLDAGRVWRGVYLDDDKVFTRILQNDPGDLCVDILLDASSSQMNRQAAVAAQGYMIAEALTRCKIPVRVSSFCSLSGYTILTRYRDYFEWDKNERIFHYFTTGCNRDGLAMRIIRQEMETSPCEHKILILLSDTRPYDIIQITQNGRYVDYAEDNSVLNTAAEVRSLIHRGIAVMCVFTGEDQDVPAAKTIYGRNFARIRHLEQFADTVGTLIQNQIRSF